MSSIQGLEGRRGHTITDQDAREISRVEELSYDLKVSETMTREVKTVAPDLQLSDVLEILRVGRISGVPVQDGGKLVGILSIEDIVIAMEQNDLASPVRKYMSKPLYCVSTYDPVSKR
jgi:CBS domain-containing protein